MKKTTYNTAFLTLFLTLTTFLSSCGTQHQLNCDGEDGVLQQAFDNKDEEEVLASLERGANPNASCTEHPDPPLHRAAQAGFLQVVEVLLERGAPVDSRNAYDETPLHLAADKGHTAVATRLIKRGAQVDSKDSSGSTPLHRASAYGHPAVAAFLLKRGAQIDSKEDVGGLTPLHWAVTKRSIPTLKLLIDQPQDFYLKNNLGQTALDIAEEKFKKATRNNDAPGKKFYSLAIAMLRQKMRP